MKYAFCLGLILVPFALQADHPAMKPKRQAVLLEGLGDLHHPVSTKSAEAQKFFDQGLRLIYAFNHDEAWLAFHRAAELDPGCAMAHWGMALAVGPNYNLDAEAEALKAAYASIQTALRLSEKGPEHERAYIGALAARYAADPTKADKKKQAVAYAAAMKKLSQKYPDDLDAATLYAESLMNLRPWELWSLDGKPAEGTEEIIRVLESVLRRNPEHTGANHYYIHAVEASPDPDRGLASAHRLDKLAPGAGHLVHMPSHIFIRVGDYDAAARINARAAEVDRAYIERFKVQGIYPLMYYSHNLHFLAVAHAMQGRHADAVKAADQLAAHIAPHVHDMPMLEFFLPTPILVQIRFQRWEDILKLPEPDAKLKITRAIWHFARGSALASRGAADDAAKQLAALREAIKATPADAPYGDRNKATTVLAVPEAMLEARIAWARKDGKAAIQMMEKAVAFEDRLNYIEPADWYIPGRELLGAMHLEMGNHAAAEKSFRDDLERNRRNGRSLFGLKQALEAQGKTSSARNIDGQFRSTWKNADTKLDVKGY